MPNLFNEVHSTRHASMRRQVSSLYSMSSLVSYEPYVDDCTSILCNRLSEFAQVGVSVDMRNWFQCYAFDVIGLITFSKRFGCLDAGEDIGGVMGALNNQHLLASVLGLFSTWYPTVFKLLSRQMAKHQDQPRGPAFIAYFASTAIESRKHNDPKTVAEGPEDFIGKVLNKNNDGGPGSISTEALQVTAGANVAAGSDTTAIALDAILYYLCRYPETMKQLRAELEAAWPEGSKSLPHQQAQSLPYLQAVVKEALRMHPATGFTMPRVVPPGGCTLAGRFFPEGVSPVAFNFRISSMWSSDQTNHLPRVRSVSMLGYPTAIVMLSELMLMYSALRDG
jgi:cytochrome P450